MKKTIEQIEDKLYEVMNALDDFIHKYRDSLNGRAYELFFITFDSVDDVLNYLNEMKSELEEGQINEKVL
jgi:hypothetical protein